MNCKKTEAINACIKKFKRIIYTKTFSNAQHIECRILHRNIIIFCVHFIRKKKKTLKYNENSKLFLFLNRYTKEHSFTLQQNRKFIYLIKIILINHFHRILYYS